MKIEEQFVGCDIALKLKELGFDEECLAFYDKENTIELYFNYYRDASGNYAPFKNNNKLKWIAIPLYQQLIQ